MADERETQSAARRKDAAASWGELASSTLLVGATAAILLTGFVLRSEPMRERPLAPPPRASAPQAAPAEGARPAEAPGVAETVPTARPAAEGAPPRATRAVVPTPVDTKLAALAQRAIDDAARIGRGGGSWTAQIGVACKPETVSHWIGAANGSQRLYVLPAEHDGLSCFRVCWGSYATAQLAAGAKDIPKGLRNAEPVRPVEIAKVRP